MSTPPLNPVLHSELFRVTDRLRKLKNDFKSVTLGEYKDIMRDLCGSLMTSFDNGLEKAIFSSLANDIELRTAAQAIARNVETFSNFLKFEKEVLVRCGVSEKTAEDIVAVIAPLREQLRGFTYDPEKVVGALRNLRDESCRAADAVEGYLDGEEAEFEAKRRALMTYGAASILANGAATAITLGAAAPLLALWGGGGGLLVTLRGILEPPKDRKPGKT